MPCWAISSQHDLDALLAAPGLELLKAQDQVLRAYYEPRTLGLIGILTVPVVVQPPPLLTIARLIVLYTPAGLDERETRLLRKIARGLIEQRELEA